MPENARKLQIAGVRLNPDDRMKLEKAADIKGQKLSEWMRKTLISCAEQELKDYESE